MAFFNFRWPGQGEQSKAEKPAKRSRAPQAESVDEMRRRARHRLIGAAVLVAIGVVGFPMVFDTQPRPIAVDVPIEIPDRNRVAPLDMPAVAPQPAAVPVAPAAVAVAPPTRGVSGDGLGDGEEVVSSPRAAQSRPVAKPEPEAKPPSKVEPRIAPKVELKTEPKPAPRPEPKVEAKPEPKPEPKTAVASRADDSARARALLEGRSVESAPAKAAADDGRFIVQVGAFADDGKAREVRSKLERAGLKTYTQVVETKDGKRTRVRVGPYAGRSEADKAAARIKSLDLSASVLTL